jgi:hypothetical protein
VTNYSTEKPLTKNIDIKPGAKHNKSEKGKRKKK